MESLKAVLRLLTKEMSYNYLFIYLFIYLIFRAALVAHGRSQARGGVTAIAADLPHSHNNVDPSHVCDLHYSSRQHWILNPLTEARD